MAGLTLNIDNASNEGFNCRLLIRLWFGKEIDVEAWSLCLLDLPPALNDVSL